MDFTSFTSNPNFSNYVGIIIQLLPYVLPLCALASRRVRHCIRKCWDWVKRRRARPTIWRFQQEENTNL